MKRSLFKLTLRAAALIACGVVMPQVSYGEAVTATVTAGNRPYAIAVNEITNKIYVVNYIDRNVTVIDGNTDTAASATVPVSWYPDAIAVNQSTNKIYVMNVEMAGNGTVSVIDGSTDTLLSTSPVIVGPSPSAMVVNADTKKVYVTNKYSGSVSVIYDDETKKTPDLLVGFFPVAIAVNTLTNKIYVLNQGSGNGNGLVKVIDGSTDEVINIPLPEPPPDPLPPPQQRQIPVGPLPVAIAVNMANNKTYVVNQGDGVTNGSVTVIDGNYNPVNIPVGLSPVAIAVNTATNKIYVLNHGDTVTNGSVTIIDGNNDTAISDPVPVGIQPVAIAVNSGTNKVYITNRSDNSITTIDGTTYTPQTIIAPVGQVWDAPRAVALNPDTNKVYVANEVSDNVTVIQNFYSVKITKTGTGEGAVSSLPIGIDCGATCSYVFPEGPAVVLFQAPANNSGFGSWGGDCVGTGNCAFSMLSDKTVLAEFILSPFVKNQNTGVAYSILQNAYNEAKANHTIRVRSTLPEAGLTLNNPVSLAIEGGYDADYSSLTGLTTLLGRVNVSLAPLRVHGVAIRPAP